MITTATDRSAAVARWRAWLPSLQQVRAAARLDVESAVDGASNLRAELDGRPATTMQQAIGLIVLAALAAGLLPFVWNAVRAVEAGAAVPLVELAHRLEGSAAPESGGFAGVLGTTVGLIAGMEPRLPGPLAGLFSALGIWLNWPLRWLTLWLVYGLLVLTVCKLFGATTTLQRFYGATGYAAVPLVLSGLLPLPWLGPLAALVGAIWALLVYIGAVRLVTALETGLAAVAVLAPAGLVLLGGLLVTVSGLSALILRGF